LEFVKTSFNATEQSGVLMSLKSPLQYLDKRDQNPNDVSYHEINLFCALNNLSYLEKFNYNNTEGIRFVDVKRNVSYYSNEDIKLRLKS
jgi:hypothetical protein